MAANRPGKKPSKWLLGCGIGCAFLVLVGIGLLGGGIYYFGQLGAGVDHAIEIREQLEEDHGKPEDYRPPAGGAVPAERLEAFLQVREALQTLCPRFEKSFGHLKEMDGKEHVSKREVWDAFGSIMGMVPLISEFFQARNQALVDTGMGLGEYTYLYILAYRAGDAALPDASLDRRVRDLFLGYLEAQAEDGSSLETPEAKAFQQALQAEIAALETHPQRLPWQDGLPGVIARSLAPDRERLDALACPDADEMALAVTHHGGLTIEAD